MAGRALHTVAGSIIYGCRARYIRLQVRHVHVRLEDDFIPHFPFCVGITLVDITVRTPG